MPWAEQVAAVLDPLGDTTYDEGYGPLTATVASEHWTPVLAAARDHLRCGYFDWLSAVDELGEGFAVVCHLVRLPGSSAVGRSETPDVSQTNREGDDGVRHLLVRTVVPRDVPRLASAVGVYAGAAWHERETREMFGVEFDPADDRHLLLPEEFEGHPLRKDFVLVSRVAKPWPGAKEPGESDEHGSPSRRRTRPPGVPEPEAWGPREPGSPAPDPLAHAQPGAARPRRTPRERPERERPEREHPDG
jgi:NADH-quinone oxidoreductase subunit C